MPTTFERVPGPSEGAAAADGLASATLLANQGRFADAQKSCEGHLRRHGASAEVFYLLGLVRDAVGHEADAVAFYRKALYLDPRHRETLVHLALLMDTRNSAEAQRLRGRALRLPPQAGAA
jgi:chemotaxis protein methyltransferase WspC